MKKTLAVIAIAVSATLGLGACGAQIPGLDKAMENFKDAPIGPRINKEVTIIEMPDGYANVATVCVDGLRYSTTTVGSSESQARALSVVVDPQCK